MCIAGAGFPTYSGRTISAGTCLSGLIFPGSSCPLESFGIRQIVIAARLIAVQEKRYWFNTRTREVEEGPKSLGLDRIGPFDSYEQALRAEEIVREKAQKIRDEEEED